MPAILSLVVMAAVEEVVEEKNLSQQVSDHQLIMQADISSGHTYLVWECARLRRVVEVPGLVMPEEILSQ
jgi:hypothetical protein